MSHDSAPSERPRQHRKTVLRVIAASGATAVVGLGSAGVANASCVSFSGINSGSGSGMCETTSFGDTAIGIGNTDLVVAGGGFNTSIAIGDGSTAWTAPIPTHPSDLNIGNFTLAVGKNSQASARGFGNSAVVLGDNSTASAVGTLNSATVIGNDSNNDGNAGAYAYGLLNRATVIGNNSTAFAIGGKPSNTAGGGNTALTVGSNSGSEAYGTLGLAAALGDNKFAHNGINNH
jgi:hypothetical protein